MPPELKAALEEMKKGFEDFKSENDKQLVELKKRGHVDPLDKEKLEKMNSAIDVVSARMEKMETAQNRAAKTEPEKDEKQIRRESKEASRILYRRGGRGSHFNLDEQATLARKAEFNSDDDFRHMLEMKALSVEVDAEGGYFVRPEIAKDIQMHIYESSPMRQFSDSVTISTDALEIPYDDSQPSSGWVGESQSRTVTSPSTISMLRIPVHELYAMPAVTQKLLDDSAFDVEGWHRGKVEDKFGRDEATAFVSGTGVAQPTGILTYTPTTAVDTFNTLQYVASGSSGAFTADTLIALQNALYEAFQPNARWMMHRTSAGLVRKLKDSQNRYLWSVDTYPGIKDGFPEYLLGKPVHFASDVPVAAANSFSAIYGDFKAGYQIVDRMGIRILRDPYTTKGQVLFYTTKRVGGGVKQFQALKTYKLA